MMGVEHRIEKLSDAKRRLLEARLRATGSAPDTGRFAASLAQRRLWFIDRLLGSSAVYNSAHAIRFHGRLDPATLRRALGAIIARHQTLRMKFASGADGPIAIVSAPFELDLPVLDLRHLSLDERTAEARRIAVAAGREHFDLSTGPLVRAKLLKLADDEHLLIIAIHHIVSDRWSVGILLRDLAAEYDAAREGVAADLSKPAMNYGQFARWQIDQVGSEAHVRDRAYWLDVLHDLPSPLEIPTDHPRPIIGTQSGATHTWRLPPELARSVESLARSHGATPYMAFAAAFQVLLSRYTGWRDIVIGTPLAGRSRVECENLIGLFVNMLPLRVEIDPQATFLEALNSTRSRSLEMLAHQQMPFEQLVDELKVPRELSRSPLFDIVFNFHNVPFEAAAPSGMKVELEEVDLGYARFDLTMLMRPDATGGMTCAIEYSTDLFAPATIERMAGHFGEILGGIVAEPDRAVGTIPLLSSAERQTILAEWSGVSRAVGSGDNSISAVHELFERHARQSPDATAVICGAESWTYGQLNERANRLAHELRAAGVGPDTLVGVCLTRSIELPTALLAIWKAGSAYLPLDPSYPRPRLDAMLEDARATTIIAQRATSHVLGNRPGLRMILLDDAAALIARHPPDNPPSLARPQNLAYVIYTSGSTGRPKGVAIEHRGAIALAGWMRKAFLDEHVRGVLAAASASFDMSMFELLLALTRGGTAVVVNNVLDVATAPEAEHVTFMICAPSAMAELLRAARLPQSLKAVALGAETVPESLVKATYELKQVERVYNLYGPTEDSIVSTGGVVSRDHIGGPPIGTPVPGSVVYLLDANLQPVPVGIAGELYIGGAKLARGYLHRPDLTRESFIESPFDSASRLYRTGDLCKWNPDGSIQYGGRVDHQIKLRGFRIELGEIESALAKQAGVHQCVAAMRGHENAKRIVAYVAADATFDPAHARAQLATELPPYMLPATIVRLDAMPLTPNGKIDRDALPDPATDDSFPRLLAPPRDEVERQLVEIWKELLSIDSVGVHDSFFELGGHSLLAVRMVDRIGQVFRQSLPLAKLFTAPTIAQLAEILHQGGGALNDDVLIPLRSKGEWPPLFCVPGIFNDAFTFEPLSRRLDKRQPLYVLLLQGLATRGGVPTTVETMAAAFIRHLQEIQPRGPYRLGGYSFGGLVAHEMAVQLTQQGEQVELLIQFDAFAPSAARQRPLYHRAFLHVRRLLQHDQGKWAGMAGVQNAMEALGVRSSTLKLSPLETTVRAACEIARRAHQSRRFPGKVLLLRATVREEWRAFLVKAPDNGWSELASGGLEIRDVDGGHLNLLQDQHVDRLARELNDYLHAL